MVMNATVLEVSDCRLLVCDHKTSQKVIVNTRHAHCFCAGDRVCIEYNGIMTRSIPPQISADRIVKLPDHCCGC